MFSKTAITGVFSERLNSSTVLRLSSSIDSFLLIVSTDYFFALHFFATAFPDFVGRLHGFTRMKNLINAIG